MAGGRIELSDMDQLLLPANAFDKQTKRNDERCSDDSELSYEFSRL